MGFLQRAFLYVIRKKGKSVLLLIILLVMATFVLTGLTIERATRATQQSLREAMGGEFSVSPNYSEDNPYFKMDSDGEGNFSLSTERPLTQEVIDTIRNTEGITGYRAEAKCLVSTNLAVFPGNVPLKDTYKDHLYARVVPGTESNSLFQSGRIQLAEGRHIADGDSRVAVISRDLAEKNNLSLGDIIPLQSDGEAQVTIIGFYEIRKPDSPIASIITYDKLENQIFTDMDAYEALSSGQPVGYIEAAFQVNDPAQLEAVLARVRLLSSIDWRAYTVGTNNETYMEASAPLFKLQTLITTILWIVVVVSAVVLSLILTMWGKSRVHETGVLLSVGIRKTGIVGQYLAEVLLIACFAFGLSFFTSNAIADGIANELLRQNVQSTQEQSGNSDFKASPKGGASDVEISIKKDPDAPPAGDAPQEGAADSNREADRVSGLSVAIGPDAMLQLYLIGFAIIILSVGISSASVMRLNPKKILSKMS